MRFVTFGYHPACCNEAGDFVSGNADAKLFVERSCSFIVLQSAFDGGVVDQVLLELWKAVGEGKITQSVIDEVMRILRLVHGAIEWL
jgi:hypothetical protein